MDPRLYQAARLGDLDAFKSLLEEDPFLLEKVALSPSSDTPLHIATLAAKPDFAREMILRMPNFAWELNQDGFSPLHIAAAMGNVEITGLLLSLDSGLCLVKDKLGRTPLHCAAIKGRVAIARELISHCYEAVKEASSSGETALDLAVKNNQFEVLKVLAEKLGENDRDQVQVQNLLKLNQSKQEEEEEEERIEIGFGETTTTTTDQKPQTEYYKQNTKSIIKKDSNVSEQVRPVVASLIATMTYQAGLNPPPSIWQKNMKLHCNLRDSFRIISLVDTTDSCPAISFYIFMFFNVAGFFSSVLFLLLQDMDASYLLNSSLACMTVAYVYLSIATMSNLINGIIISLAVNLVLALWLTADYHKFNAAVAKAVLTLKYKFRTRES